MSQEVIIIGAGIGGLATANILAKAGYHVSVYEQHAEAGGRAGTKTIDGFTFDTGPSWYLMPDVFKHYFSLFDMPIEQVLSLQQLSPAYKVFFENNQAITITTDQALDSATFESIEPGAGKKLQTYVAKGNSIYQLSLKHFLYTNFQSLRDLLHKDILKHALTMGRLAFTSIDRYIGKFVQDQRLRQILEYPMVFLGSSPFSAPAIYSLMSALDFNEGVYYPKGGLYEIICQLVGLGERLGVSYHYNTPVSQILSDKGRAIGITLASGETIPADIVISNADIHYTETTLLSKKDRSFSPTYWNKIEAGPSALLLYLGVKGSLPTLEHHNLYFVDTWQENFDAIFNSKTIPTPASLYICKPSAIDSHVAPPNTENLFVLVPLPPGVSLSSDELNTLAETYLQQIAVKLNIPDLHKRLLVKEVFGPDDFYTQYYSWQNSALGQSHILRQSAFFRTRNKSRKLNNLYYVGGNTVPGIGLPMCLIGAELIYKRLAGDKHGGPIDRIENLVEGVL